MLNATNHQKNEAEYLLSKHEIHNSTTMHLLGRVTMLFANNSLMECLITMKFYTFFLNPDVIFSSHTMLINAST